MAHRYPPMAQRMTPALAHYFDTLEPPSRQPSPWATMTTPSEPSPGPPPSPAVWMHPDWTPTAHKATSARSLPLVPNGPGGSAHEMQALRTNTTFSPLPTHPEFLRNLQSHPMIIERREDLTRSPSPASSLEFVQQPRPQRALAPPPPPAPAPGTGPAPTGPAIRQRINAYAAAGSPVPFPSDPRFASPSPPNSGTSSPRPLPSVHNSHRSLHSVPSVHGSHDSLRSVPSEPTSRPTPVASPDSAAALSSSPRMQPVAMPRPRLPALQASNTSNPSAANMAGGESSVGCKKHPVFYMQEGMVVLKVGTIQIHSVGDDLNRLMEGPGFAVQDP
ncbi:hypothetical protein ACG7TL_002076 [Trametes sanguinea]